MAYRRVENAGQPQCSTGYRPGVRHSFSYIHPHGVKSVGPDIEIVKFYGNMWGVVGRTSVFFAGAHDSACRKLQGLINWRAHGSGGRRAYTQFA